MRTIETAPAVQRQVDVRVRVSTSGRQALDGLFHHRVLPASPTVSNSLLNVPFFYTPTEHTRPTLGAEPVDFVPLAFSCLIATHFKTK